MENNAGHRALSANNSPTINSAENALASAAGRLRSGGAREPKTTYRTGKPGRNESWLLKKS
jgi:hypothetical protein